MSCFLVFSFPLSLKFTLSLGVICMFLPTPRFRISRVLSLAPISIRFALTLASALAPTLTLTLTLTLALMAERSTRTLRQRSSHLARGCGRTRTRVYRQLSVFPRRDNVFSCSSPSSSGKRFAQGQYVE